MFLAQIAKFFHLPGLRLKTARMKKPWVIRHRVIRHRVISHRIISHRVIRHRALFLESRGTALLETVIALTIFAALGTALLMGVRAAHISGDVIERNSIAENLARNQMEYVFDQPYLSPPASYVSIADAVDVSYTVEPGFSVTAQALAFTDGDPSIVNDTNLEKVLVTVSEGGQSVLSLDTLRANE